MSKLTALLLALCLVVPAWAESYRLRDFGELTLDFPPDWTSESDNLPDRFEVAVQTPNPSTNASARFTVLFSIEEGALDTKAKVRAHVTQSLTPVAAASVEKKVALKEFRLKQGYGFYCNLTDASLVGRESIPGVSKVMSMGVIRLAPNVVIAVTILADDFKSEEYKQLLRTVESVRFTPDSGAPASSAPPPAPAAPAPAPAPEDGKAKAKAGGSS